MNKIFVAEKLVSAEEGKVGKNLEPTQTNETCKKFMRLVQFILVLEIALFLGWACYSYYQSKYLIPEDHLKLNPISAPQNNLKLNSKTRSELDIIAWQEKSNQDEAFNSPSSSEPWTAKTPITENPDSSTERDLDLLNTEDSVYDSGSSSLHVTTPEQLKISIYENYMETTENVREIKTENEMSLKTFDEFPAFIDSDIKNFPGENESFQDLEHNIDSTTPLETESPSENFIRNIENEEKKKIEDTIQTTELHPISTLISNLENEYVTKNLELQKSATGVDNLKNKLKFGEAEDELEKSQEESHIPNFIQMLHDLDRTDAETEEVIPATEIIPLSEENFKKYIFQISLGPETEIKDSHEEYENSQKNSEHRLDLPFFIHVFFNASNIAKNASPSENITNILKRENMGKNDLHTDTETISNDDLEVKTPSMKGEDQNLQQGDTLMWWVNIPQFQDTMVGDVKSEGEPSIDDRHENSALTNEEYSEKNLFDLIFDESHSLHVSESEEVEDTKSPENLQSSSESLDEAFVDIVSSFLSSKEFDNKMLENLNYPRREKCTINCTPEESLSPLADIVESYQSSEEAMEDKIKDVIEALNVEIEVESTEPVANENVDQMINQLNDLDKELNEDIDQQINSIELKHEIPEELIPDEAAIEEKVRQKLEDLLKILTNTEVLGEDHKFSSTQSEGHLYEEESMTVNQERAHDVDTPEDELAWKIEEDWFHTQPTWKEEKEEYFNHVPEDTEYLSEDYEK